MSLKILLVRLFLVAATFVLPTGAAAASAGVRRNMAEEAESDLDADFLKYKLAWVFGAAGLSCDTVCTGVSGTCNAAAQNAVDTTTKLNYVVVTGLGRPAPMFVNSDDASFNPSFQVVSGTESYLFNPAGGMNAGTCAFPVTATQNRICCCGTTAQCPTS
jgi:hypothetical protein